MQKVVRLVVRVASRSAPAKDAKRENKPDDDVSGFSGTPVSIGGECITRCQTVQQFDRLLLLQVMQVGPDIIHFKNVF